MAIERAKQTFAVFDTNGSNNRVWNGDLVVHLPFAQREGTGVMEDPYFDDRDYISIREILLRMGFGKPPSGGNVRTIVLNFETGYSDERSGLTSKDPSWRETRSSPEHGILLDEREDINVNGDNSSVKRVTKTPVEESKKAEYKELLCELLQNGADIEKGQKLASECDEDQGLITKQGPKLGGSSAALFVDSDPNGRTPKPCKSWSKMLSPELVIYLMGRSFSEPLPLQSTMLPAIGLHHDLVVVSNRRAGSTWGYIIPAINKLVVSNEQMDPRDPSVVILVPSWKTGQKIRDRIKSVTGSLVVSNASLNPILCSLAHKSEEANPGLLHSLTNGCQILIATPPSLTRLTEEKMFVHLGNVSTLIIEESDKTLRVHPEAIREVMKTLAMKRHQAKKEPPQVRQLNLIRLNNYLRVSINIFTLTDFSDCPRSLGVEHSDRAV